MATKALYALIGALYHILHSGHTNLPEVILYLAVHCLTGR